jgi:hypothetical protein
MSCLKRLQPSVWCLLPADSTAEADQDQQLDAQERALQETTDTRQCGSGNRCQVRTCVIEKVKAM